MIMRFIQATRAYKELFETGGIQCKAEGDYVLLDLRGNITGDILLFIGPKNKTVTALADIYGLIQTDKKLIMERKAVFKSLNQKFKDLSLLPESLVWVLNIVISALYTYRISGSITAHLEEPWDLRLILTFLPLLIFAIITPFLAKRFGFKLLRPSITIIQWIARHFRKARIIKGI